MMHGAPAHVVADAGLEVLAVPGVGIAPKVVQGQHLVLVRAIVLADALPLVVPEVCKRRHRPPMVERGVPVRQHEHEQSIGAQHACPLRQRAQRVRDVLEHVRRQHEVVAGVRHFGQAAGFDDEPAADLGTARQYHLRRAVPERPFGIVGEVHVREPIVQRPRPPRREDAAWSADLQRHGAIRSAPHRRERSRADAAPRPDDCGAEPGEMTGHDGRSWIRRVGAS